MLDLKDGCKSMFGSCESYHESFEVVSAQYRTAISDLPSFDKLVSFFTEVSAYGVIEITFEAIEELSFIGDTFCGDDYYRFIKESNEPEDEVKITLIIRKNEREFIPVYCFDEFEKIFINKSAREAIILFSDLFKKRSCIKFLVLDRAMNLSTNTIVFSSSNSNSSMLLFNREQKLKDCENASLFLNRTEIRLIPQDFEIIECNNAEDCALALLFKRLEMIFNFIYLANSSYLTDDKLVLQFDPSGNALDFKLEEVQYNSVLGAIYKWVFGSDTIVEHAGIARNIISINCKNKEQLCDIKEDILNSIKSNYQIYQKSSVEKYIEVKKNIANNIIDTSRQIQEMTEEFTSGFQNNFIAVVMFFITAILTDGIGFDDLFREGIPANLIQMCHLFSLASIFYYSISLFGVCKKWRCCLTNYLRLKNNYKEILDPKDLDRLFSNDSMIKETRNQLIKEIAFVSVVWIFFIILMWFGFSLDVFMT